MNYNDFISLIFIAFVLMFCLVLGIQSFFSILPFYDDEKKLKVKNYDD